MPFNAFSICARLPSRAVRCSCNAGWDLLHLGMGMPPSDAAATAMHDFLRAALAGASGAGVIDLCIDHKLIAEQHPAPFTEISGLELFPDLEELSISMHALQAATGIAHLQQLQTLDLSNNALSALGEIPACHALRVLYLSHNALEDLDGIAALTALEELEVGFNLLQSVAALAELSQLSRLVLNGNRFIRNLEGLPPGLRGLHLNQCFIHDYTGLARLMALMDLSLSPGSMRGLDVLSELPHLSHLRLQGTRLHGHVQLPALPSLERLTVSKAVGITGLGFSAEMPQLKHLELTHAALTHPPDLRHCPQLELLEILFAPLQNLDGIAALPALQLLRLNGSAIPVAAIAALQAARPDLVIEY